MAYKMQIFVLQIKSYTFLNNFSRFIIIFQALIGVAYSVGFIVGPVIGAIFSKKSESSSGALYILPALFTLALVSADIAFLYCFLQETLPEDKRVKQN